MKRRSAARGRSGAAGAASAHSSTKRPAAPAPPGHVPERRDAQLLPPTQTNGGSREGPAAYLYGVVRWPPPWAKSPEAVGEALGTGVGDPPRLVGVVVVKDVAALVSRVTPAAIGSGQGVRGLRRDMRAHANVLNRVVALGGNVLPAAFGLTFPQGDQLADRFLRPRHTALASHLARLDDAVEVTLKVTYVEGSAIQDVVAESPDLARAMGRRAQSLDSKIELGKRVAQALRGKRDHDARRLLAALTPVVRDAKVSEPGADLSVLNASLLVSRATLPKFDNALEALSRAAAGRMQFDCVGPLPPYSFVDLRL